MGDGADDVAARAGRRCAVLQRGALVLQRGALRFPWARWVEMRREGSAKAVRECLAPQPEDVAALDLDVHFRDQVLYHVAQVPAAPARRTNVRHATIPARNRRNAPSKVTAAAEPLGLVRTHVAQSMFGTDDSGARHRSCGRRRTCSATSRRTLPRICHASRQMRRAAPVALRTRHLARAAPLSAEKTGTADGFDAKAANAARYIAAAVSAKLSPPAPAKRRAFGAELCKDGRSASRRGTTGCAKGRALQQVVLRAVRCNRLYCGPCVATGCTGVAACCAADPSARTCRDR